jgi:SAM-dependent methyltransferase
MSHAGQSIACNQSYGDYILRTGTALVSQLELAYGAYWFHTRFAGQQPILDLGAGRCWFAKQDTSRILALDNARPLVEHYRREGINIHHGSAYQIPFPGQHFQGVFCCWLFEHLAEPNRAMREIHRVLKPGGQACVIVPSPRDMMAFYDDYTHVRPFTPISLTQLAEDAGFSKYRITYLPWDRGASYLLRWLGSESVAAYLRFSDCVLRRIGLVNARNLVLDAWN